MYINTYESTQLPQCVYGVDIPLWMVFPVPEIKEHGADSEIYAPCSRGAAERQPRKDLECSKSKAGWIEIFQASCANSSPDGNYGI